MKRFLIIGLLLAYVLTACGEIDSVNGKDQFYPDLSGLGLTKAHGEIAAGQMDFGVDFFKNVAEQGNLENVLVSPFSMSLDLSMLAAGATDETYDELVSHMGFKDFSPNQIGEYYTAILNKDCSDKETVFKSANALWINTNAGLLRQNLMVKEDYKNEVKNLFDADAQSFDFDKTNMVKVINDWAKDNTDGIIDEVLTEGPMPLSVALLTNALYFNGIWTEGPYPKVVKNFVNLEGESSEHDFFKGTTYALGYNTEWKIKKEPAVITIPYGKSGNSNFSMVIIVPPATESFADFVNNLSASNIRNWVRNSFVGASIDKGPEARMNFYVPMFSSDFSMDNGLCEAALKKMGINRIFASGAQLSKISEGDIMVNRMLQKTSIEVNEKGTVAAAVSYIEIDGPIGIPPQMREYDFVVDRPFVYIIMDSYSSILFMGTVTG